MKIDVCVSAWRHETIEIDEGESVKEAVDNFVSKLPEFEEIGYASYYIDPDTIEAYDTEANEIYKEGCLCI